MRLLFGIAHTGRVKVSILPSRVVFDHLKSTLLPASAMASPTDTLGDSALRALRLSESRYRRLFETARVGILLLNSDTAQIEDVNPYLIQMLVFSHAECLGQKLWEVGPFSDRT